MNLLNLIWLVPVSIFISLLVNYLAETLPVYRKFIFNPVCPECNHKYNFFDYLMRFKCSNCSKDFLKRKSILMIVFIITYVLLFIYPPEYAGVLFSLIIFTFLSLVFIIDIDHKLILHPVSIFGAILFAGMGFILNGWKNTLLGGGIGFILMYALYLFGILFTKWISKRRGIEIDEIALGYGDVNLTAILGLLFGWPRIIVLLFFAILLGGIFSALYMIVLKLLKKYDLFTAIPYAPFLIISSFIMLYISTPR